ncbi:hypothetical protein TNCV_3988901 [Trichonephila clavipes]|nr:hypothetical protein TNCV_3988901 [Trichonephila clavipes]
MGWHLGDHLIGPYILPGSPDWSTLPDILATSFARVIDSAHVTAATVPSMWFSKMEPPHISEISVRITRMQHV